MAVEKVKETPAIEKEAQKLPPKIVKISESLLCELNEVEWQNRARELADAHRDTEGQKENKKSIMAELNSDVKAAEARETKLANIVATRTERREVTVEVKYDYELSRVIRSRTDTGEVISDREMTSDEKQQELFDANDIIESRHEEA